MVYKPSVKKKEKELNPLKFKYFVMLGKKKDYISAEIAEKYHVDDGESYTPFTRLRVYKEVDNG